MTIEQIDSNRILIALCDDDMKSFSLEFESMTLSDPHVKEMIQRLLKFASNETGISVKNKKMLISTNLSLPLISKRYSERISSRIIGEFKLFKFFAEDIRIQLNLKRQK